MAANDIRVRLHLRELHMLEVITDTPQELRVRVESSVRRPRCVACGFRCSRVHDRREREIRDSEISRRRTTLVWLRRRFDCEHCGHRWLEDHPEFDGKLTQRLARQVVADAQVMPVMSAARRHGLGWHLVMGLVKAWTCPPKSTGWDAPSGTGAPRSPTGTPPKSPTPPPKQLTTSSNASNAPRSGSPTSTTTESGPCSTPESPCVSGLRLAASAGMAPKPLPRLWWWLSS